MPKPAIPGPKELFERAEKARERAYLKVTNFDVGAALVSESGRVFTGANIENDSAGLSMCAERVAVFRAVAAGHRRLVAIAVAGPAKDLSPCGACRQVLAQFSNEELAITYRKDGRLVTKKLGELLQDSFQWET
jgi:cytidine deaminase